SGFWKGSMRTVVCPHLLGDWGGPAPSVQQAPSSILSRRKRKKREEAVEAAIARTKGKTGTTGEEAVTAGGARARVAGILLDRVGVGEVLWSELVV
ncbi:unnamed protein product, partial [Polarella glacialis]